MMSYYLAPLPKTEASLLQKNNSVILGLYALADMGIHYDAGLQLIQSAFSAITESMMQMQYRVSTN